MKVGNNCSPPEKKDIFDLVGSVGGGPSGKTPLAGTPFVSAKMQSYQKDNIDSILPVP